LPYSHPPVGKQFGKSALGMRTHPFEEVAQVGEGIDAKSLAGGDEADQHRCRPAANLADIKNEGVKKSIHPVILSEAKNLQLFVFKKINADASLRSA